MAVHWTVSAEAVEEGAKCEGFLTERLKEEGLVHGAEIC